MEMEKAFWNKKKIVLITSIVFALLMSFRDFGQLLNAIDWFEEKELRTIVFQVVVSVVLGGVLSWLVISTNIVWDRKPSIRFLISLSVATFFCAAGYFIIDLLADSLEFKERGEWREWYHSSITKVWVLTKYIIIFVTGYVVSLIYTLSVKKMDAEKKYEKLRAESLNSELKALNNQINPHFFFNALNSLHSLIIEDHKDKSLEYLVNLSNVFRYILQSDKKTVVKLNEEMEFLNTYRYMLQVKYDKKLKFNLSIDERFKDYMVPVLSLLPVIENVTKHNEVSNMFPMEIFISVTADTNYLLIRHQKRERFDSVQSVGSGLENLSTRYKLLVNKEIVVEDKDNFFSVYLPLVK